MRAFTLAIALLISSLAAVHAAPPHDGSTKGAYGAMNAFALAVVFWERCGDVGYQINPENILDFGKINGIDIFEVEKIGTAKNVSARTLINMYFEQVEIYGAKIWCGDSLTRMRLLGIPVRQSAAD